MSNQIQPAPEGTASPPRPNGKEGGSPTMTYTAAGIACFIFACAVYIMAKPVEKTGPPRPGPEQGVAGALPQGHPDTAHNHAPPVTVEQLEANLEMLREAEKAHADDPILYLTKANLLYDYAQMTNSKERFAESLESYRKYLEFRPDDIDARTDMAYTLYRTGQLDASIEELRRVQGQDPRHQQSAYNLTQMYREKDRPDSVLFYLKRTADIDPTTNAGRAAVAALNAYKGAH